MDATLISDFVKDIIDYYAVLYKNQHRVFYDKREYKQNINDSWAITELREYLLQHIDQPLIQTLEEFQEEMRQFSCKTSNEKASILFSSAYDIATDMIDRAYIYIEENKGGR